MTMTWFQLSWLHEISQSALAAAVVTLGLVILLELRSIKLLRRSIDNSLGRVFEQLDLLRFEQQPVATDAVAAPAARNATPVLSNVGPAATATAPAAGNPYVAAAALASTGMKAEEIAQRCGLAAGEARLLASLAAARIGRRADA
ncbi:MAG TPA: DUF2802 domain-containing protein [Steroidobacteraceae bacterium]|nr:DUF2802 domain-containing protein [Steroidobacteraceae bacterium]